MCGRFALAASESEIKQYFGLSKGCIMRSRYNIAPGSMIPAIRYPGNQIDFFKWGFIPSWTKMSATGYINARAETLFLKPTFKSAILRQRCIIPATGYYEWRQVKDKKQPYYMSLSDYSLFGFAGVWDVWQDPDGNKIESCAIITVPVNGQIYDRLPLILSKADHLAWLAVKTPQGIVEAILERSSEIVDAVVVKGYPVSPRMNNPQFDTIQCLQAL